MGSGFKIFAMPILILRVYKTDTVSMHTSNISLGRMNHKDFTQFASSIPQKLRLALLYGALDEVEWHAEAQYDCMELGSQRVCTIMPLFDGPLYM